MASTTALDPLERQIVDHFFVADPASAVGLGLHEYDGRLPDLSLEATERWGARADELLRALEAIDPDALPPSRRVDRFLLRLLLESELFELREANRYEQNPMTFVGAISLTAYVTRAYAPAPERTAAAVRVLEGVPALLQAARRRLAPVLPAPFVDLALVMGDGLGAHFDEAEAFARAAGLGSRFADARRPAEAAIAEFLGWLRSDAKPRTVPDFALGPKRFQRLLFVREGVEVPFDEVRRAGAADLARNQARLAEIARAEKLPLPDLFERLNSDHPAAAEVLPTAQGFVEEAKSFVGSKDLASVPEPAICRVEETPSWARALTTASMDSPGPFETRSSEGIYYVTLVDPTWSAKQQEEWLRSLNRPILRNVTIHEVYPGHYLQHLHFRKSPGSLVRKVYMSSSFTEGWAHYTEQLAIESGLDPGNPLAEVAQIHDALLRNCRLLVSIGLHTNGWTLAQATEWFQREAHFERLPAEREALRGTYDPGYFCYTLGKLAILDARKRFLTSKFGGSLRAFHDAVLGFGAPPIGLLEQLLESA